MAKTKKHDALVIGILAVLCVVILIAIIRVLNDNNTSQLNTDTQNNDTHELEETTRNSAPQNNTTHQESVKSTIIETEEPHFTYSKHQACGVAKNVYCVLLADFSPSQDWQQRINNTASYFIKNELGGGSASDYLIYFFQNAECYQQKITSKAMEMCSIPNGEVAASSWGKFYYEYEE